MRPLRRDHSTRKINQAKEDCRRDDLAADNERARRCVGRDRCDRQKVERHQERGDGQDAPARGRQFPTMFGVKANAEQRRGDGGEDQKLQHWNARDLCPQTDYQRCRATDNQNSADNLSPANVALLHERGEDFRERTAWRFWFRLGRTRLVRIFGPRAKRWRRFVSLALFKSRRRDEWWRSFIFF